MYNVCRLQGQLFLSQELVIFFKTNWVVKQVPVPFVNVKWSDEYMQRAFYATKELHTLLSDTVCKTFIKYNVYLAY